MVNIFCLERGIFFGNLKIKVFLLGFDIGFRSIDLYIEGGFIFGMCLVSFVFMFFVFWWNDDGFCKGVWVIWLGVDLFKYLF